MGIGYYYIMNDLSIVCFTCKRDEELLPLHFKAIRRVTDNPVYYIVSKDDYSKMKFPKGSNPVVSDFNRNGNLIGVEALKGMLACYGYFGTSVLKIDSDVVLMGIDWINRNSSLQGFSPNR